MPKGTIYLESHWFRDLSMYMKTGDVTVSLSYGPLAHGTQHGVSLAVLTGGGRTGIYSQDIKYLFDDVKKLRPTTLIFPPRVYNELKTQFEQMLRSELEKRPTEDPEEIDKQVRNFMKTDMFGGRVWRITTGT